MPTKPNSPAPTSAAMGALESSSAPGLPHAMPAEVLESSATHGPDTPPRRGRRKDARPGELVQAALSLFVEKGFAATRAEEVAARAGVSKGTLFLYFESKEELFKAVVRETIGQRFVEWEAEFAQTDCSTAELMARCLQTWWDRVGATPAGGISKLMLSEAGNFPELAAFYQSEVVAPGMALIRRILQRGIDRGEFVPMDLDHTCVVLIAPLIFLNLHRHSLGACAVGPSMDASAYLAAHLRCAMWGLCRRDTPTVPPAHGARA
jgi:TetR/AcrR family transcriptional regulator